MRTNNTIKYTYIDRNTREQYTKVKYYNRYGEKFFCWYSSEIKGLPPFAELLPYHSERLTVNSKYAIFAEGEKDADTLTKFMGIPCSSFPNGQQIQDVTDIIGDRIPVFFLDNDKAGRGYMERVKNVYKKAIFIEMSDICVLTNAPYDILKDITEYFEYLYEKHKQLNKGKCDKEKLKQLLIRIKVGIEDIIEKKEPWERPKMLLKKPKYYKINNDSDNTNITDIKNKAKNYSIERLLIDNGIYINLRGFVLCPFHEEKTASMHIDTNKNVFYCHGCQEHGDVITLAMYLWNKNFVETVKALAEGV